MVNLSSDWVNKLIEPLVSNESDVTRGVYLESSRELDLNKILAIPLIQRFFPEISYIKQPLSSEIAAKRNTWINLLHNQVPFGWGINIWFLIEATIKQFKISEVLLGYKEHRSSLNNIENTEILKSKVEEITLTIINEAIKYNRMKNIQKISI